jgi:hypothetical protein
MVERIQVQSSSPFEIYHILNSLEKVAEITVEAELFLPPGEGPFGCVIALHGSMGWAEHHQDHINGWLKDGLAVCKVNSFSSRSIDNTVDDQLTVTHAMMIVDAFRTREMLAQDPDWQNCADQVSGIEKPELVADGNDWLEPTDEWLEEFNQTKLEIKYDRPYVCDESFDV